MMPAKAIALSRPARPRVRMRRPSERTLALLLVAISGSGSLGTIGLWIAGQFYPGLQVLSGSILLILALLLA
jgi:hypothetical protein